MESHSPHGSQVGITTQMLSTPGLPIEICLTVEDYFGTTSAAVCHTITTSALPLPAVTIRSVPVTLESDKTNTFEAEGFYSACNGRESLIYIWTISPGISSTAVRLDDSSLNLPLNVLEPNTHYIFQLEAWTENNPTNVGSVQVSMSTNFPDLRCIIQGSGGTVSTIVEFVADASASYDPANQTVELTWECKERTSEGRYTSCRDLNGNLIIISNSDDYGILRIPANSLPASPYTMEATIRETVSGRVQTCSNDQNLLNLLSPNMKL